MDPDVADLHVAVLELQNDMRHLKQQRLLFMCSLVTCLAVLLGLHAAPLSDVFHNLQPRSGAPSEFFNDTSGGFPSPSDDEADAPMYDEVAAEAEWDTADHCPPLTAEQPQLTTEETMLIKEKLKREEESAAAEAQKRAKRERCKEDPAERRLCSLSVHTHRVNLTKTDRSLGFFIYCDNVIGKINNRIPGVRLGDKILAINGQPTDRKSVTIDILNSIPIGEQIELLLQANETCFVRASLSMAKRWFSTIMNVMKLALTGKLADLMNKYHHRIRQTLKRWPSLYWPGVYLISTYGWHWVLMVFFLLLGCCCLPEAVFRWLVDNLKADEGYLEFYLFGRWLVSSLPKWLIALILVGCCTGGHHVWCAARAATIRTSRAARANWSRALGLARQPVPRGD